MILISKQNEGFYIGKREDEGNVESHKTLFWGFVLCVL